MRLVLASQSAARRAMLEAAGVPFAAVSAYADEAAEKARLCAQGAAPEAVALGLAAIKAQSLVRSHADALLLGADQTLECADGALLSKARDLTELRAQLRHLSGQTHRLHSAAVLISSGKNVWSGVESATLAMRPLSDTFIADYVARLGAGLLGCVGGYMIEGEGVQLFERIEGSHFTILGLPLLPLLAELRTRGVIGA